jgi:TolB protein
MSNESRFPAWAWWIIGVVTILAVSILIFSVVLGIRAGQEQVDIQRRQQIGIALQQATDAQAEGKLQFALDAYQKVLVLDPGNDVAQQGIKNLLAAAAGVTPVADAAAPPAEPAAAAQAATPLTTAAEGGAVTPPPTLAATPTNASLTLGYWEAAQASMRAGRWQEALVNLTSLQQADPLYRSDEVADLLYQTYLSLATEQDNEENLEGALQYYERALLLRPDSVDAQRESQLIAAYLDVLTYSDVDWPRAIELLETLYTSDPQYRDVETRLQAAHAAYGDQLAETDQWCLALAEYDSALSVSNVPALGQKRDAAQVQCEQVGDLAVGALDAGSRVTSGAQASSPALPAVSTSGGPAIGRILYSAKDTTGSHYDVMQLAVGRSAAATTMLPNATQPALRSDGARMAFRNQAGNQAGISSFDPDTGLMLRFTEYAEDSAPSWNPAGSRLVFASNREGDRRWRIYLVWAEVNGGVDTLDFGEAPNWHPFEDLIVFRGCDQSGNNCGLWTISSSGGSRAPLTNVPDDNRPVWSPDGSFVVFMSSGRDGNYEIYRVETESGQVTRLTNNAGLDVLPVVSPDGAWVAYASNRDGSWKIWAVPSSGGAEHIVAPITGDMGAWQEHGMQWVY